MQVAEIYAESLIEVGKTVKDTTKAGQVVAATVDYIFAHYDLKPKRQTKNVPTLERQEEAK